MLEAGLVILGLIIGGAIGAAVVYYTQKPKHEAEYERVREEIANMRETAERETQAIIAAAQEEAKETRVEVERVTEKRYQDIARAEERLDKRQASQDKLSQRQEVR